ncbi:DUF4241 domain-containing protein [uncultured Tateyamaria sp.]|uniref:DUF4241 domain-containing protein n=1 Tax=uncultured Tateyamaria sp. TaxID=455651 RepID=UPI002633DE0E|nr:DUF4241 domain-containing protein [uncultured Tateyamaria sp.]
MTIRTAALFILLPFATQAGPGAVDWITTHTQQPLKEARIGSYDPDGPIIGVDSLTYEPSYSWPYIDVPDGPADFHVFFDSETGRVSKAALIFSDAVPSCGKDLATMPVDTGTGAFLDRKAAEALDRIATETGDLYGGFMEPQIDGAHSFAKFLKLPGGHVFPAFQTGWGDGGYPVASLHASDGAMIAIYADFMGKDADGKWLLPTPCAPTEGSE